MEKGIVSIAASIILGLTVYGLMAHGFDSRCIIKRVFQSVSPHVRENPLIPLIIVLKLVQYSGTNYLYKSGTFVPVTKKLRLLISICYSCRHRPVNGQGFSLIWGDSQVELPHFF